MEQKEKRQHDIARELAERGNVLWHCTGISMLPLIHSGRDVVVIERAGRDFKPMDIVMYTKPDLSRGTNGQDVSPENDEGDVHSDSDEGDGRREPTKYILHRVLEDRGDHCLILGDNCYTTEIVPKENILGVMRDLIKEGKPYDFTSSGYRSYIRFWIRPWRMRIRILCIRMHLKRAWWKSIEILSPYTPRPVKEAIKALIRKEG